MHPVTIVLLVILVILIGLLIGLYFFGKKTQKKQEEQQAQIEASKQTVSMLVIDKKRMPLKESGLPQMVIDQTPKLLRRSKLPIVKAKVGPKISILIADEKVFDAADDARLDKVGALGVYLNGHIGRFELELLCVDEVRGTKCSVGPKVLVKLDVEFRQLRFLHAAGGKNVRYLLPADNERLVGFELLVRLNVLPQLLVHLLHQRQAARILQRLAE